MPGDFDWVHGDPYMYGSDPNWISYFRYMHNEWEYFWPYTSAGVVPGPTPVSDRRVVAKDASKHPRPGSFPIPAELKSVVKKVAEAYAKGDARVRESAAAVPGQLVLVPKEDLASRAVHEKAVTWDKAAKHGAPTSGERPAPLWVMDPRREAGNIARGIKGPAGAPRRTPAPEAATIHGAGLTAVPDAPGGPVTRDSRAGSSREVPGRSGPAPARFRDWNPDLRVARELGVHIEYSSVRNEVRCPELRLSSHDRLRSQGLTPRLTAEGVAYGPATSVGGGSAGGSSSTASAGPGPSAGRAQSDGTSTGSGGRETKGSGTSEGGKIKN